MKHWHACPVCHASKPCDFDCEVEPDLRRSCPHCRATPGIDPSDGIATDCAACHGQPVREYGTHVVCCQPRADYSEVELETLRWLAAGSLIDGWLVPAPGPAPSPELWETDPDAAREIDQLNASQRRYTLGCARLFRRGLIERRRDALCGRAWSYRLPEHLRSATALVLPPARA